MSKRLVIGIALVSLAASAVGAQEPVERPRSPAARSATPDVRGISRRALYQAITDPHSH